MRLRLLHLVAVTVLGGTASAQPPSPSAPQTLDRAALAAQVRDEFLHAWRGYVRYAWGHDELRPVSKTARDWYASPLAITPVDALDALLLLGFTAEAESARAFIDTHVDFDLDVSVKTFEITIRTLGGLLSSYQMTGDDKLLSLAEDLGTRLLPAFDSPTGMPYVYVNLQSGATRGTRSNPAEIGTLLLEFGTLAKLTHRADFYDKPKRAVLELWRRRSKLDLLGEEIDVETGKWTSAASHVGGGIDSFYEYALKSARLFDDADCAQMWRASRKALERSLADATTGSLWYGQVDMTTGTRTATEFGALHAFLPAVLALGGDVERAARLQNSCYAMWTQDGIEPELIDYRTMHVEAPAYPLRPEIIESAYYLEHYTKDPRYLAMGQEFFEDLKAHCRTEAGYTVLKSVVTKEQGDLMPSYFLAETLKYLYLLFAPDSALDFDHVTFTTEAHPLRRTW